MVTLLDTVRDVVRRAALEAGLPGDVADAADLQTAGLNSFDFVTVMVELEETFAVRFPPAMIARETFLNTGTLTEAVERLVAVRKIERAS